MTDFTPDLRDSRDFITEASPVRALLARPVIALADYVIILDLNRYRQGVSIRTAKQQGVRGIICKTTQGIAPPHPDQIPTYEHYRDETKARGLSFGGYHYWDASKDPIAQAQHFYDVAGGQLDFLPGFDVEKYGNENVLPQPVAAQHIQATANEIISLFASDYAPGMIDVMLYTNRDSWQVLTGNSAIIKDYELWVASWTTLSTPVLPIGVDDWLLWQYTNQYVVEGYDKGIDANRFKGNEGQFEDYIKSLKEVAPPTPPPTHEHPILQDQITALQLDVTALIKRAENIESVNIAQAAYMSDLDQRIDKLEQKMKDIGDIAIR